MNRPYRFASFLNRISRDVEGAVPYDFRNRYVVIIPAAVKMFRRRERKIGTGAGVLAYVKVVPVAPFDAYGSSLSKKKFRRRGA